MAGQAMDACHFVKAYSGGDPPVHLNDLDIWSKTLKWMRDIHGSAFKFLPPRRSVQDLGICSLCSKR
eukprot:8960652-Pyramimonas_sp.AAC.1